MKFLSVESQKPTRDERSWVIDMAEAGFNINHVAFHFNIHKTIPPWGPGGLSRECVLRIPSVIVKGD